MRQQNTLFPAEHLRLEDIASQLAALRTFLTANPEPGPDSRPHEWFAFLGQMKRIQGKSDNWLAFVTTMMAKDFLIRRLPVAPFDAAKKPQGASGLDIDEVTTDGRRVIAEIKATVSHKGKRLGAKQSESWQNDFDMLNREDADYKFFFVADKAAFDVARELYGQRIPGVTVVLLTTEEEFICPVLQCESSTASLRTSRASAM